MYVNNVNFTKKSFHNLTKSSPMPLWLRIIFLQVYNTINHNIKNEI